MSKYSSQRKKRNSTTKKEKEYLPNDLNAEELDMFTGYWIENAPYILAGDGSLDVESIKRTYPQAKSKKSIVPSSRLFETTQYLGSFELFADKMEGRNYHNIYGKDNVYPTEQRVAKQVEPSDIWEEYAKFSNTWFDLSFLVCTTLRKDKETFIELEQCPRIDVCNPCTEIGHRIAKSLVRIASLRIFAEAEQSIMELPVNSIDAYNPQERIGKFGMGFFSFLYWLIGHPKRILEINSWYMEGTKAAAFTANIMEIDGNLGFSIKFYNSMVRKTGTFIRLLCDDDPLDISTINSMANQMSRLAYVQSVSMYVSTEISAENNRKFIYRADNPLNNNSTSDNLVFVGLDTKIISIEDYATGISSRVFLNSLLIPSISTKTIKSSEKKKSKEKWVNNTREIAHDARNYPTKKFYILVGDVAVVSYTVTMASEVEQGRILTDSSDILLCMPPWTRVPVSRDDILLTDDVLEAYRESVQKVLKTSYGSIFIRQYISTTSSDYNSRVTQEELDKWTEKMGSYFVLPTHQELYSYITKITGVDFITSNLIFPEKLSATLDGLFDSDDTIFFGKKVVVLKPTKGSSKQKKKSSKVSKEVEHSTVPSFSVSNGGTYDYIFLTQGYIDSLGDDWEDKLVLNYQSEEVLYPTSSDTAKQTNKEVSDLVQEHIGKNFSNLPLIYILMAKIDHLEKYFDFDEYKRMSSSKKNVKEQKYTNIMYFKYKMLKLISDYILVLGEERTEKIISSMLYRFNSIEGTETYGAGKYKIYIRASLIEMSLEDFFKDKALYNKAGDKLRDYTTQWIILAYRNMKVEQTTYLPSYPFYCPIQAATRANDLLLISYAVINATSFMELSTLLFSIVNDYLIATRVDYINNRNDAKFIQRYINHIFGFYRSKISDYNIGIYRTVWDDQFQLTHKYFSMIRTETIVWLNFQKNVSAIPVVPVPDINPKKMIKFLLSNFIIYAFDHDIGDLSDTFEEVSQMDDNKSPLQTIEIAVNEGTTKHAIDAVVTELTQNSIDAIRQFDPTNKNIDIRVGWADQNRKQIVFKIQDYVGMSAEAFLAISIPFLSTKTPSEVVTGEMGSGFFNSYRETDYVIVDSTDKKGTRRIYYDIPIRSSNSRTIDIEKYYTEEHVKKSSKSRKSSREKESNGTSIYLVYSVKDEEESIDLISRFVYVITSILAAASIETITFNDASVHYPRKLLHQTDHFELYMSSELSEMENIQKFDSYILTKGVPFTSFYNFFNNKDLFHYSIFDNMRSNILINILHQGYVPVQTRTKISMPADVHAEFNQFLDETVFIVGLHIFNSSPYHIDNYRSTANVTQLRFTTLHADRKKRNMTNFTLNYKYKGRESLSDLFNRLINGIGKVTITDKHYKIMQTLVRKWPGKKPSQQDKDLTAIIEKLIIGWFKSKNKKVEPDTPPPTGKGSKDSKGSAKKPNKIVAVRHNKKSLAKFETLCASIIELYWKIGNKLKIVGFTGQAPSLSFDILEEGTLGSYKPKDHSITLNTQEMVPKEVTEIVAVLEKRDIKAISTLKNSTWNKFFAYEFPASVVPHELEHARRRQAHTAAAHGDLDIQLPGKQMKTYKYNQIVNEIYNMILLADFWSKFISS